MYEAVVVGAGLSGLSCARILAAEGVDVHVIDAADEVGGRVRTDHVEGFSLDRGFQVLLTAYEEVPSQVDVGRLDLHAFDPGSIIWNGQSLETLGDPFRRPASAMASLGARVGSLADKARVGRLRHRLTSRPPEAAFQGPERSTEEELRAEGFSADFINTFFRPFLGGVFLERDLATTASLFRYYFRCFSVGDATLPAGGMQRLPELLAEDLEGRITLGAAASKVTGTRVSLSDGRALEAKQVVLAVDGIAGSALLGEAGPAFKQTITSYFTSNAPPVPDAMLVLDGEGSGPANHVAVVSNVAPGYAPPGQHLISVSGVDEAANDVDAFQAAVPAQLSRWFGPSVSTWRHLRTYCIAHALPRHPPGGLPAPDGAPRRSDGLILAGDHTVFGAIQGALLSGRKAAEAVLQG